MWPNAWKRNAKAICLVIKHRCGDVNRQVVCAYVFYFIGE
jgi:hypothetical protein